MKSVTQDLKNAQTAVLAKNYGARLQRMYPETKLHLVNLVTSAALRNLSVKEVLRHQDIPFDSASVEAQYLRASEILRDLPTDRKTIALLVKAIVQTIY